MAVQLYLGFIGCDGHFDDAVPCEPSCKQPPPLTIEHMRLLPVGDSVNINTLYFTFITFLLGFHGDDVSE